MEEEATTSKESTETSGNIREKRIIETGGIFTCGFCSLREHFDYKGTKPPFAKQFIYLEECYIMKDPFSPLNRGETLVLGSDCSFCKKTVCLDCSIFYTKRFCKICAHKNIQEFPSQLHKKIMDLSKHKDVN